MLAVRTNLPAGARKTWRLMSGRAPAAVAGGVTVQAVLGVYEITNGLTGAGRLAYYAGERGVLNSKEQS